MQNCELFQSICEGGVGGWEEGWKGISGVAASTLRLYCMVHTILYYCPSRTITHICTSADKLSSCLSVLSCLSSAGLDRVDTQLYCCSTRTRIRSHVLHALAVQAVCHIVGPTKTRQGPSRFALGLTTTVGMIKQGRLDSVLWFCNTCNFPAQPIPIRPWNFPWCSRYASPPKTGCTVVSTSLDVAHAPFQSSQSSSCSRTDVAGREGVDLPRNGYRTRNAAVLPRCLLHRPGARRRNRLRVGPPPIKCSVWRWAKCI